MYMTFLLIGLWTAAMAQAKSVSSGWSSRGTNSDLLSIMKSYMNAEADPCNDFYDYACGNWENVHTDIPKYVDTIGSLEYAANRQMAELFERKMLASQRESNEVYRKVVDFYASCRLIESFNVDTYLEILRPVDGGGGEEGWPKDGSSLWRGDNFNWLKTIGRLRSYGLNGVLIKEDVKSRNASEHIIQIGKADNVEFNKVERNHLRELENSAQVSDQNLANDLRNFKQKLLTLIHSSSSDSHTVYEMTLDELEKRLPGYDLKLYLENVVPAEILTADMPIQAGNIAYLRKVQDLVAKTSKSTVIHYIILKLKSYLRDQMPISSSPHHCVQTVRGEMSLAIDHIYDLRHFRRERRQTEAAIMRLFRSLQSKFSEIIDEHSADFSGDELQFLKDKISLMELNIGNLPRGVSDSYYADYYTYLQIERPYFYWNHLNAMQQTVYKKHELVQLHATTTEHGFFPWKYASPVYQQTANLLVIPFSYLQMPIFQPDFHELFIYAELGNSLGHEMLHGFDMNGLMFDGYGNPSTLFADAMRDKQHFRESIHCLTRQFTKNINEKIADFSGFRLAYESYFHRSHWRETKIDRSLSDKQLFFIKFAQFFCAVDPRRISYDETHDTPFKRVPQAVANYQDFAVEFNCPSQAIMNPSQRCNMW